MYACSYFTHILYAHIQGNDIISEVRTLALGDFLWIARPPVNNNNNSSNNNSTYISTERIIGHGGIVLGDLI